MSVQNIFKPRARRGFTIVELLIVIGIIVILIALILPATQMTRARMRTAQCAHNLTQIGSAFVKAKQRGADIQPESWYNALAPFVNNDRRVFHCPEHGADPEISSFGMSNHALDLETGQKVVMVDYRKSLALVVGPDGRIGNGGDDWNEYMSPRHRGKMNVLYNDGHVALSDPSDIDPMICRLHDEFWKPARKAGLYKPGCLDDQGNPVGDPGAPPPPKDDTNTTSTGGTDPTTGNTTNGPPENVEDSVDKALIWLVRHQKPNGSWSLRHQQGGGGLPMGMCAGRCPNECTMNGTFENAATGMALMVFLGSGSGPGNGDFQEIIAKGVNYLLSVVPEHGTAPGNMDGHKGIPNRDGHPNGIERGLATMALVEAYRSGTQNGWAGDNVTVDPVELFYKANLCVNYLASCQDLGEGGFRRACKARGDITITSWIVQALKSAERAGFPLDPAILQGVDRYLDLSQSSIVTDSNYGDMGTVYSYMTGGHVTTSTKCIGNYLRLYLGHPTDHQAFQVVSDWLAGPYLPLKGDRYAQFYAHHFMYQIGGDNWATWNQAMQDYLLPRQETAGHREGSWWESGHYNTLGGRHYVTCYSLLCLEEYYQNIVLSD